MKKNYRNITQILNKVTPKCIRWCTPSIIPNIAKVMDGYKSDISVSFEKLGFPSDPSGIFLTAYEKAAKAYKSDKTLFSVNGSTGSNFVVLRSLSKQIPNLRILAQRNIHKSILHASQDYGINLLFLEANIDPQLQIFLPNSIKEFIQALNKTKPNVLLLTNPTYEGLTIDLKKLIAAARKTNPDLIIFVDEAWGGHLSFSKHLPISAMQAGADICVQSTHKQGGALQQTSMIHWREDRIDSSVLLSSYRNLSTTSPSYILLASLDAAREYMQKYGEKRINNSLSIAKYLSEELSKIDGFNVINLKQIKKHSSTVFDRDHTKVIVDVTKSNFTGIELSKLLEEKFNIIVEKYNATTILFLVPFQSKRVDVHMTVRALKFILKNYKSKQNGKNIPYLEMPQNLPRILEISDITKLLQSQIEIIPLSDAKGRISAENITPYPPGIPTTIQGEEFTAKAISFYQTLSQYPNSHIMAHDITLKTVRVVK